MKFNDYLRQIVVGSFTLWANPVDLSAETRSESELIRKLMETPVKAEKDIEKKDRKSEKQKRISYKTNDFSEDSDKVLLARLIFGEGRNCSYDEQISIGFTSFERANDGKKWNGETIREAILCPSQYSCFNKNDPNYEKIKDPEKYDKKSWTKALKISEGILSGKLKNKNLVPNATHFHTHSISPKWSKSSKMKDLKEPKNFKHNFYREK